MTSIRTGQAWRAALWPLCALGGHRGRHPHPLLRLDADRDTVWRDPGMECRCGGYIRIDGPPTRAGTKSGG